MKTKVEIEEALRGMESELKLIQEELDKEHRGGYVYGIIYATLKNKKFDISLLEWVLS